MAGKRDFLSLLDVSVVELQALVDRAIELKRLRREGKGPKSLAGKTLGMIFEKSSTRTRVSFEVGMFELGGHAVYLSPQGSQLGRGEPIRDTARVLSGYCDAILIRTFGQERVVELAKWARVPVINGLTDEYHPCQLLADLQTVRERVGSFKGVRCAWVGDGNNMAHSWMLAAASLGMHLSLACPEGYLPSSAVEALAADRLAESGGSIRVVSDPQEAVQGAQVISTDVWASMGQEDEAARRQQAFAGYCVDEALLSEAAGDVIVLHCLPAHRGEEISEGALEGEHSAVWQQAENRLHAQKALLESFVSSASESP